MITNAIIESHDRYTSIYHAVGDKERDAIKEEILGAQFLGEKNER